MLEVQGTAPAVEKPCLGEHEARRAQADDDRVVRVGVSQVAQRLLRVLQARGQQATHDHEVVERRAGGQQGMRAYLHAAARRDGVQRRRDDLPVAIDLPAEIRLVGRMAQAVDEGGERRQREARREEKHAALGHELYPRLRLIGLSAVR